MAEASESTRAAESAEHGEIANALQEMPYGMYVIGSVRDGEPNGMLAHWVTQIAFRPHMIAVSFQDNSYSLANIRLNKELSVNLLARASGTGMWVAQHFVQPHLASKIRGAQSTVVYQKLEGVDYTTTKSGLPLLSDSLMWLECRAEQFVDVGGHTLVIAHAIDGKVLASDSPLTSDDVPWPYSG
jgi:flavin reductase (DIM6/NTAB) family NADH-FMN oxidoreductase RutF